MIHPTAVIHPKAQLDPSVKVGPYAVIDEAVVIGPGCVIGPHVYLTGHTTIGADNRVHAGCVVGNAPQDLKYKGDPTHLRIGDRNTIREHVTINRSTSMDGVTVVGSDNLLMTGCHVAHDVVVGNRTILVNGCMLGGHVVVGDRAVVSGSCLVHQFVRVGTLAMMQGGAAISKDLPPFTVARGYNRICGLNVVGLRRAGMDAEQRLKLKQLYHMLFRSGTSPKKANEQARKEFSSPYARELIDFVASSKRGLCADVGFREFEDE